MPTTNGKLCDKVLLNLPLWAVKMEWEPNVWMIWTDTVDCNRSTAKEKFMQGIHDVDDSLNRRHRSWRQVKKKHKAHIIQVELVEIQKGELHATDQRQAR